MNGDDGAPSFTPVPTAPGALPALGHGLHLARDPLAFLSSLPAHGDVVWVGLGPHRVLMVCDPVLTRQVLLDSRTFDKGGPFFDRIGEVVGNGVGTCPAGEHPRLRRRCQPSFHPGRMPAYAEVMAASAAEATAAWSSGEVIDVGRQTDLLATHTLVRAMFSAASDERLHEEAIEDVTVVLRGILRRTFLPEALNRVPLPANRRYERAMARLRERVSGIVAARRADPADHADLLSALLTADGPDQPQAGPPLTGQEVADQVMTFFIAGTRTTAATLAWAMYALATHPQEQTRVQEEADQALAGRAAGLAPLTALAATERVITETLRLYSPGWLMTRLATRDTVIGHAPVPAGTMVAVSPWIIHHRPDLHPRPEHFDPARWAAPPVRGAFLPFGAGARKCIGDRFALTQVSVALTHIASRWHLAPAGRPPQVVPGAALFPRGMRLRVHARHTVPRG
ncbi:cytochrome P450 [Streptomyces syringium]|uniref:cytochrome P450 n=1 Tax=Streptomyces syringium TaxID=76729 RepID=UPI003456AEBC